MVNYLQKTLLFLCTALVLPLSGQEVSFINQSSLLNPISGSSYEDCAVDMNGDNLDDIVRVTPGHIFIDYQQLDGSFEQVDFPMSLQVLPSWSMCAGDLNADGFNDLLLASGSQVSFVYSNSDGTAYTEVAQPAYIFSQRSTINDIDNDGDLDAFVCHDIDQSHPFRNDGTGAMTLDQTLIETADRRGNYAALWVDYDNDGDSDLYITKCKQGSTSGDIERTNLLYQNNGDGTYSEVAEAANMADNAQSWTTVFEDFDNDGDFDAFIVNHDFKNRLMRNNGDGTFTDIIEGSGINTTDLGAWENAGADFNNDGFVDIFSEMDNELYLNNGDMTFTGQNLPFPNGGIGDMNNDGFLDIIRGNTLWINQGNENNWVKICTPGLFSNKNGIGARVEIYGDWGMQIREVRSSQSFSTMNSLETYFGIGQATQIDSAIVKWPSGITTKVENIDINSTNIIHEADCILTANVIEFLGNTTICEGTSITLGVPEGYDTYLWNNGETTATIEASEARSYSVIATDNEGCIAFSNNVTISFIEEVIPEISVNGDNRFCAGGSVELLSSASEDTNPVWSNGMTGSIITVSESGSYTITTDGACVEQLTSSAVEITALSADVPTVETIDFTNTIEDVATITVTGDSLLWYETPDATTAIASGNTFVSPPITEATTYYVESLTTHEGNLVTGGNQNMNTGGGLPGTGAYSYFDAWEAFTLASVEVQVPASGVEGIRHIQLVDANDIVLAEKNVDLIFGIQTIELDWEVPTGTGLSIRCLENNLFRSNAGVNYPYPISTVGEITDSYYGSQYYYYFYNWKIQGENTICVSERIAIDLTIVGIDELPGVTALNMYPNPANDKIFLSLEAESVQSMDIRLFNTLGQEVKVFNQLQVNSGKNTLELNVKNLPSGVYSVQFVIEQKIATGKIILD